MINTRLKIVQGADITYVDVMQDMTSYNIGSMTNDITVVEANRYRGMSKGVGLIKAGRKLKFDLPIFECQRIDGENDIYKLISKWTTLLSDSYSYEFYLEQEIDNYWYSAEIVITEIAGYNIERVNLIKSFSVTYVMVDNFYSSPDVVEDIVECRGSGELSFNYTSKSLVPCPINFRMKCQSNNKSLAFGFMHINNYGIVVNTYLGGGSWIIEFDGDYVYKTGIDGVKETVDYSGVQPFLQSANNEFKVSCNYNITEFVLIYKKGIGL